MYKHNHVIMYGLPGCGKTTYVNKLAASLDFGANILRDEDYMTLESAMKCIEACPYNQTFIWDFPITTLKELVPLLRIFSRDSHVDKVTVVQFPENRKLSLERDAKRNRDVLARNTISYKSYDVLKLSGLKNYIGGIELINGDIEYTNKDYEAFKEKHDIGDIIESDRWSLGGTCGNCWNSDLSTVDGDAPLDKTNFKEVMDIITNEIPNVGWLGGMKIMALIESTSESEGDYYGGSVTYVRWTVSSRDLFDAIMRMKVN